jgi:hypothetical protein
MVSSPESTSSNEEDYLEKNILVTELDNGRDNDCNLKS